MSAAYLPLTKADRDRANAYLAGMAARGFDPMPIADLVALIKANPEIDPDGHLECGCVPGHRSSHLTHRCAVCGFSDADMENGTPVPPCKDI